MEEGSSTLWQHPVTLPKLTCPCPVLGDDEALTLQLGVTNGSGFLGAVDGQQAAQVAVGGPALVVFSLHCSETLQGDVVWGQKEMSRETPGELSEIAYTTQSVKLLKELQQ